IVNDAAGRQARKPLAIEVGPPPPPLSIRTETLPQAVQGLPYNASFEASGGIGPYVWNIESGALPDDLTMNAAGVITGRATTHGATSFVIRVRDSLGTASTKSLFLIVTAPPPPLGIKKIYFPETRTERRHPKN